MTMQRLIFLPLTEGGAEYAFRAATLAEIRAQLRSLVLGRVITPEHAYRLLIKARRAFHSPGWIFKAGWG